MNTVVCRIMVGALCMLLCVPSWALQVVSRAYYSDARFPERKQMHLKLSNGLTAWVTSDALQKKSAAAVVVNTGSASDPKQAPGTAHFLEHMLFLSTKKYPMVDDYFRFIDHHNGSANAYTASDHTAYYFQVASSGFAEALDRLAQFFIAPTMDPAYVQKELKAVDAEHAKNIKHPGWRLMRAGQMAYASDHPWHSFSTGSSQTLGHIKQRALWDFFRTHYHPHNMHIAVVDTKPLSEIEKELLAAFAKLKPAKNTKQHRLELSLPIQREAHQGVSMVRLKGHGDESVLRLEAYLPSTRSEYARNHLQLLESLLNAKSQGGLHATLLEKGLATSVQASCEHSGDAFDTVTIYIRLTDQGYAKQQQVLATINAYVKTIKNNVHQDYYKQEKQLADIEFMQATRPDAMEVVEQARLLAYVKPEHMQRYGVEYSGFDAKAFAFMLSAWQPHRMTAVLMSPQETTDAKEQHYQLDYRLDHVSWPAVDTQVAKVALPPLNPYMTDAHTMWQVEQPAFQITPSFRFVLHEKLQVPVSFWQNAPIDYASVDALHRVLAAQFASIDKKTLEQLVHAHGYVRPRKLVYDRWATQWYVPNRMFKKAGMHMQVLTDKRLLTPRSALVRALYAHLLNMHLEKELHAAHMAAYVVGVRDTRLGFSVYVEGYPQHWQRFSVEVAESVKRFAFDRTHFEKVKAAVTESLRSHAHHQGAMGRAWQVFSDSITPYSYSPSALLAEMASLDFTTFEQEAKQQLAHNYVDASCFGNASAAMCTQTLRLMTPHFLGKPLAAEHKPSYDGVIPDAWWNGSYFLTPQADTGYLYARYLGKEHETLASVASIANKRLQSDFFKRMRTENNLGYIAKAHVRVDNGFAFLSFYLQSKSHSGKPLKAHIETYLKNEIAKVLHVDEATFDRLKASSQQSYLDTFVAVSEGAEHLSDKAYRKHEDFEIRQRYFQALDRLTYQQYLDAVANWLAADAKHFEVTAQSKEQLQGT